MGELCGQSQSAEGTVSTTKLTHRSFTAVSGAPPVTQAETAVMANQSSMFTVACAGLDRVLEIGRNSAAPFGDHHNCAKIIIHGDLMERTLESPFPRQRNGAILWD